MSIPSWDDYFIKICNIVKLRSKDPKTQVGSCLVSNDNRIISTGYNSLKAGVDDNIDWDNRELVHNLIIHSEMNCLLYATSRFENTTLYSTLSPCCHCIKLIGSSGVVKVIFQDKYKDYDVVKEICIFYNIELKQIGNDTVYEECEYTIFEDIDEY